LYSEVKAKAAASDVTLAEIDATAAFYAPLAAAAAAVYFTVSALSDIHYLYRFALPAHLAVVDDVLRRHAPAATTAGGTHNGASGASAGSGGSSGGGSGRGDVAARNAIARDFFLLAYTRVARAMLAADRLPFAFRMAQIALRDVPGAFGCDDSDGVDGDDNDDIDGGGSGGGGGAGEVTPPLDAAEVTFLCQGTVTGSSDAVFDGVVLTATQTTLLSNLSSLPTFCALRQHVAANAQAWQRYTSADGALSLSSLKTSTSSSSSSSASSSSSSSMPPDGWQTTATMTASSATAAFRRMLIARALRPDLLAAATSAFVAAVFGKPFADADAAAAADVGAIVAAEGDAHSPLLLVARAGVDTGGRVDALAASPSSGCVKFEVGVMHAR
jgi:dynein heavy chain 1